jgi:hypothetical protein
MKQTIKIYPRSLKQTALFLALVGISSWLMFSTFSHKDSTLMIDSKLWSDFGAHLSLVRSFSYGQNFPGAEYPTFPGEPIRYHYLFYLLVALLEKGGLPLSFAMNLVSTLGFILLLFYIHRYAATIFNRFSAGVIAIFLFLFNGSLSFINFFKKYPLNPDTLKDIITNPHFVSFGPWDNQSIAAFWNLNIYTNQRHLALSFALSLITIWPLTRWLYRHQMPTTIHYLTSALILFCLPLLNQAAFAITLIMVVGLIFLNLPASKHLYWYYLIVLLTAIPGIIRLSSIQSSALQFNPGFLSQDLSPIGVFSYWFLNLGLYLLIYPVLLITNKRPGRSILLSAGSLFLAANLFQFSPDMINNHKLINFFLIITSIFTAGFLVKLWQKGKLLYPVVVVLVVSLTFSGFIDFFPIVNDRSLALVDIPANEVATWIYHSTPQTSVFLTTEYLYNPASLAGRKTYLDYGYFNWSLGYQEAHRRQLLPQFFSSETDPSFVCQLLTNEAIDYILISPGAASIPDVDPTNSAVMRQFKPIYVSQNGYHIFDVQDNCER